MFLKRILMGHCFTSQMDPVTVCDRVHSIGKDPSKYGGHIFRSGANSTAAQRGIGDASIKLLGGWRSSAYQLYVKTPPPSLAVYSRTLAQQASGIANLTSTSISR